MRFWNRQLDHYPAQGPRRLQLCLVVLITVALYYALYVGGGVTPLVMQELQMPFIYLVGVLALASALGAFASLLAGLSDRFGRANLTVYGLLVVSLLTAFAVPAVTTRFGYAVLLVVIGFVEGIILVATPALIRDFSPQVGRATAMGFWTIGPVLGSLMTSAVNSATLPINPAWRGQFLYCGVFCLVVWVLAFLFLRELKPALRDQVMVSDRDRALVELRAQAGTDLAGETAWRKLIRLDVIGSALGVSMLLLVYYTTVAFGVVYLVTAYGFTAAAANGLLNWSWATNAVALVATGIWSDALGVRKPFMLIGGVGSAVLIGLFMGATRPPGSPPPDYTVMVVIGSMISVLMGAAYATWMASFTETVEAHSPALTATGLAIWGWLLRLIVTGSFLLLPAVVNTVTPLVEAPYVLGIYGRLKAAGAPIPPELGLRLQEIGQAAAAAPGQWALWYEICAVGAVLFVVSIFTMRGRWSPARAKADALAHEAEVQAAMRQTA